MNTKTPEPYPLQAARINHGQDTLRSIDYGDVYYSRHDGLEESRHVFLQHNQLPERWMALSADRAGVFTIAETGFGTGLNLLAAWQLWQKLAPPGWRLHFVSLEKHPLSPADLKQALALWPELDELAALLLQHYPPLLPGQHRLQLATNVTLDLLFGDALACLRQIPDDLYAADIHAPRNGDEGTAGCENSTSSQGVNAWFLDGFAPASNPQMWQTELFALMAQLSAANASFATFTAAGEVRRGLQAAGFAVRKVAGHGRKRDMLCGEYLPDKTPVSTIASPAALPWHTPPTLQHPRHIAVIGAGLAGSSSARALAERGLQVTVIERADKVAAQASGNPQGILFTRLSAQMDTLSQFSLHSFLYALRHYRDSLERHPAMGAACGMLQLIRSDKDRTNLEGLRRCFPDQDWVRFIGSQEASELAGLTLNDPAIHFPGSGWLSPKAICERNLDHPNIRLLSGTEVAQLRKKERWHLLDTRHHSILEADAVVIATAQDAARFGQSRQLPLKTIRGQLTYLNVTALKATPRSVICHEGYLAPPIDGQLCIGATYDAKETDTGLRDEDHQRNLQQLRQAIPGLLNDHPAVDGGRAAVRCGSPDYLPICGAAPDMEGFIADYAALRHDARSPIDKPGRYHSGLYLNVAHGSRGLTSTPLCAEIIVSLICGEIRPLPNSLMRALSPARFLIRDLIRRRV